MSIAGPVDEQFDSPFFRNAVDAGRPAMTVSEAKTISIDGDAGAFDRSEGTRPVDWDLRHEHPGGPAVSAP